MSPVGGAVSVEVLVRLHQLYAAQSHWIDGGCAREWAGTFTGDGEFQSPSYPEPAIGTEQLTAFAERFFTDSREAGEVCRHVVTNLFAEAAGEDAVTVHAYLQIVGTPDAGPSRLIRLTTLTDDVVRRDGQWLVQRRVVRRDDEPR